MAGAEFVSYELVLVHRRGPFSSRYAPKPEDVGEQRREKKIAMKVEIILLKCDACQKKKKEEEEENKMLRDPTRGCTLV